MSTLPVVAVAQLNSTADIEKNLKIGTSLIEKAKKFGAKVVSTLFSLYNVSHLILSEWTLSVHRFLIIL